MKISIVLSTQPASFSALAYKGHWEENVSKTAAMGYDGVELAVRDPRLLDMSRLKSVIARYNLAVPAIGTGQAFGEEGLSFTDPDAGVRRKAVERVLLHVALAHHLGSVVIVGLVRGKRNPAVDAARVEEWLIDALRECASADGSVRLAVEPINRYETDLINTVASGLDLADKVGKENVGLLLDTFHMNIEERSLTESIFAAKDRLFHFHVADSNRWYPGSGHVDFQAVVDALRRAGYRGFVSAEILPLPDPDTAASGALKHMRPLLRET